MGRGHLGEPDGGGVVKDFIILNPHNGLACDHKSFSREAKARTSKGFHDAKGPRDTLDTVEGHS